MGEHKGRKPPLMRKLSGSSEKLSLKNDGTLQVLYIGCGSAFSRELQQTNFLVVKGDAHLLVDFGMTGPAALAKNAGLGATEISCVLPTHSHADHVGGFEYLALTSRYILSQRLGRPKTSMLITSEYKDILWEQTLKGGLGYNEHAPSCCGSMCLEDYFQVQLFEQLTGRGRLGWHYRMNGLDIKLFRTIHIPDSAAETACAVPSYGLLLDDRVFISGDTRFDPALISEVGSKAEYLIHDVQFFDGGVHASMAELLTLPEPVRKRMYLVHYGDEWRQQSCSGFAGWIEEGVLYDFGK